LFIATSDRKINVMKLQTILNRKIIQFLCVFWLAVSFSIWGGQWQPLKIFHTFVSSPAIAQTIPPESVSAKIYQQIPDLPKENQFINKERQQADPDNTLVSRLVRYHIYVKNRPLDFRLDWKLTIADYFNLNEDIKAINYPGSSTLTTNPLESDRQIITKLNRQQRDRLVDTLVSIYNPQTETSSPTPSQPNRNPATQKPTQSTPALPLPKPGDAQLLK
jgi:hypothetical protein